MPNFQPSGIIHIGNVPFNDSYLNVRLFDTALAQETWMLSHMNNSISNNTYTYVRLNNAIRVQGNAEDLYTYNYCMFKNANYGNKWFYSFITQVNYVNENCTEFILELDVMQTWMFDYTLQQGYVEREHTNDDTIGKNLNAEPEFNYNTVVQSEQLDADFDNIDDYYTVLETTKSMYMHEQSGVIGSQIRTLKSGEYQNIYNGSNYILFDRTDYATENNKFTQTLEGLNRTGDANSITGLFLFPKGYAPPKETTQTSITYPYGAAKNTAPITKTDYFLMPTNLNGYTPRNNKLFTFPYCYPAFCDMNGNYKEYKFELWTPEIPHNSNEKRYMYKKQCIIDSAGELYITPQHYDGVDNNYVEAFVFKFENRLSWMYDGFNNWLAQNSMRMFSEVVSGGIGVANNLYVSSVNRNIFNKYTEEQRQKAFSENRPYSMSPLQEIRGKQSFIQPALTGLKIGVMTPLNIATELYSASKTPNEKRGSSSGNGRYAYSIASYSARVICLQYQFAERLDSFFDKFGYATELVKIPNIRGRESWNFVKMQNAAHYGNIPNDDMETINEIYNRGVTFWHNDYIGDYSRSNLIVNNIVTPNP